MSIFCFSHSVCIDEKQRYTDCLHDLQYSFEDKLQLKEFKCCLALGREFCMLSYLSDLCKDNYTFLSKKDYEFHFSTFEIERNEIQTCPRFLCYIYPYEIVFAIVALLFFLIAVFGLFYFGRKSRKSDYVYT